MRSLFSRFRIVPLHAMYGAACVAGLAVLAAPVLQAQDLVQRSGEADREIIVREHAGWDRTCAAIAPPVLHLDAAPVHGIVCARSDDIRIEYVSYGSQSHCIGRTVRGLRLVYRPHAGFVGADALRYVVQYPKSRRDVGVSVTVVPAPPATSGAAPTSMILPPRQAPGVVPPCNDFLS